MLIETINGKYELRSVCYPEFIDEIGELRVRAWRGVKGIDTAFFEQSQWVEELDKTAMHWVVMLDNRVVAAARMSLHAELDSVPYSSFIEEVVDSCFAYPLVSLNRLVVHPNYRGLGFANRLDNLRIEQARKLKAKCIIGEPNGFRQEVFKGYGFRILSPVIFPEFPKVDVKLMIMDLLE